MGNDLEENQLVDNCESCGEKAPLFEVEHHQEGNAKKWRYCERCTNLHNTEVDVNAKLKELATTHPDHANDPEYAAELREGKSVEEVRAEIGLKPANVQTVLEVAPEAEEAQGETEEAVE